MSFLVQKADLVVDALWVTVPEIQPIQRPVEGFQIVVNAFRVGGKRLEVGQGPDRLGQLVR